MTPPVTPPATTLEDPVGTASAGNGGEALEQASRRMSKALLFDASCWFGTDPATIMPTTPVHIENVHPGHCEAYWENEYATEDVLMFRDLARSTAGGGSLVTTTDGMPTRSRRYRELLAPRGYGDHLRAALRVGDNTWGVVDLFRNAGREPFTDRDVELVAAHGNELASTLADLATSADHSKPAGTPEGPGTVIYDETGNLVALDDQADRWLEELTSAPWHRPVGPHPLMAPIWSLLSRARTVEAGRDNGPASARLRTSDGRWLILEASSLRSPTGQPGLISVTISPANSSQIAPITVEAYGLTPREKQVTHAVARGLSNADIATELHVSVHTVRDHLKAVFTKMTVTTRGELVAKLFAVHYAPGLHGQHVTR